MAEFSVITSDFVNLSITRSNAQTCPIERRFQKNITIDDFKGKLELITGGNSQTMKIDVFDKNDKLVCHLNDGNKFLGYFPLENGMRVHVTDNFSRQDEDLSRVEKFELSEDEYAKRTDTLKTFLVKNKLGKYDEEEMKRKQEEKEREEAEEEALARGFKVGNRCEIQVSNQPRRRGTIMFIGKTDFKEGWWIGVKYDEPLGKNDGSVNGKRYFECPPKYGGFVKPAFVSVGNFPEEEFDLDEEI